MPLSLVLQESVDVLPPHSSIPLEALFSVWNMEAAISEFKRLLISSLSPVHIKIDEPENPPGIYWVDVSFGSRRHTLEYRRETGFGFFHDDAGYGERPAEFYRTPKRAAQRLEQLMRSDQKKSHHLGLKDLRDLYGHSQVKLAKKAGVKQPAISRFEKRGEVKLSTLAATIKALGGKLEIRAQFPDADVPISLSTTK